MAGEGGRAGGLYPWHELEHQLVQAREGLGLVVEEENHKRCRDRVDPLTNPAPTPKLNRAPWVRSALPCCTLWKQSQCRAAIWRAHLMRILRGMVRAAANSQTVRAPLRCLGKVSAIRNRFKRQTNRTARHVNRRHTLHSHSLCGPLSSLFALSVAA